MKNNNLINRSFLAEPNNWVELKIYCMKNKTDMYIILNALIDKFLRGEVELNV